MSCISFGSMRIDRAVAHEVLDRVQPLGIEPSAAGSRDMPLSQDWVVWRNANTGDEIARSPLSSAVNSGTMVEPAYDGHTYFLAQNGEIIELTARTSDPNEE